MAWVDLDVSDIEGSLNAGELDAFRQQAAQIEDPLAEILADVTALVRGYVAARYKITEDGIPEELRTAAIDIVIYRLAKRVKLSTDGDPQRKVAADDAIKLLMSVAKGEFGDFGAASDPKAGCWGSETKIATGLQ